MSVVLSSACGHARRVIAPDPLMCPDDPGHGDPRVLSRTENLGHFGRPDTTSRRGESRLDESMSCSVETLDPRGGQSVRRHDSQIDDPGAKIVATTFTLAFPLDPDLGGSEDLGDSIIEVESGGIDGHHPGGRRHVFLQRPGRRSDGIGVDHVDARRQGRREHFGQLVHIEIVLVERDVEEFDHRFGSRGQRQPERDLGSGCETR